MRFHKRSAFTLIELLVVIAIIAILAAILFPVFAKAREKARTSACSNNVKQINLGIQQYVSDYDDQMPYDHYGGPGNSSADADPTRRPPFGNPYRWTARVEPYVKNQQIYLCPSGVPATVNRIGYWSNGLLFRNSGGTGPISLAELTAVASTVVFYDDFNNDNRDHLIFRPHWGTHAGSAYTTWNGLQYTAEATFTDYNRKRVHNDGVNVAFADGHVKWQKQQDLVQLAAADPFKP